MDYSNFKAADFVMDESFQKYCLGTNNADDNFWTNWIKENPLQQKEFNTARDLYRILNGHLTSLDFKKDEAAFNSLLKSKGIIEMSKINQLSSQTKINNSTKILPEKYPWENTPARLNRIGMLWKAAAMFILIAGISSIIYFNNNESELQNFTTGYGNIDTLTLPDKSVVILNSNSKVSYKKNWNNDGPRELWLEGEAFFDIKHINRGPNIKIQEQFIVHAKNISIQVLGTQFNVRERRDKTEIVLQQGSIRISFKSGNESDIILQPGQLITTGDNMQPVVSTTTPEEYIAWKSKKLILTNATLKEIVEYLEDNFGKQIILMEPALANRKIEGTFKLDNLDDALLFLSKALNLDILQEKNKLFISTK